MRIYLVGTPEGQTRLIRATNRQHAVWYVAQSKYLVRPAGQDDLVDLIAKGVKVEMITSDDQHKLNFGG
jgi:hypothetical protein